MCRRREERYPKVDFLETLILCTAGGLWVYCLALSFPLAWISGYVNSCLMFPAGKLLRPNAIVFLLSIGIP